MIDTNELKREEQFWDAVGSDWLERDRSRLLVSDPHEFLSGSSVAFDYMMEAVGDVRGRTVLDYGCGSGWLSTYLAQKGAHVEGFDISQNLVDLCMKRAGANGVHERVRASKMIAERLDYPSGRFDLAVGISILHHISLAEGGAELHRVLKPGGLAFFIEPLGESGIVNAVRNYVLRVHHGRVRAVGAEHPLTYADIRTIGASFSGIGMKEFQLAEMIARLTGDRLTKALGLRRLDSALLEAFPSLRKYCRLVVIRYAK